MNLGDPLLLAPGAFLAGVLMFLAPCTLPLVPGYLAFIAGVPAQSSGSRTKAERGRILLNAVAFVVGFSLVFIAFGTFAAALGALFGVWRPLLGRLGGFIIILFGLTVLGMVRIPGIGGEWHARLPRFLTIGRWESSLLIGALFALGWSPCIGPILGTVLLFASNSATLAQGALLLGVFSLGLAVPFMLIALMLDSASRGLAQYNKLLSIFSIAGGAILVALGVLIVLGDLGVITSWGYGVFDVLGLSRLYTYY